MALLDLLGRRWALRLLWELREEPVPTFRDLQARTGGISSSVLSDRLSELSEAGIVERGEAGYALTLRGYDLMASLAPLNAWAAAWSKEMA